MKKSAITSYDEMPLLLNVKQLNGHLWKGRYSPVWPDGKKHSRNAYGRTEEECEEKLADLIL